MVQEVFLIYISLIISVCAILAIIARAIRQPPLIAYLIAGVLVGPLFFNWIGLSSPSAVMIQTFSRIGVAFLLFIVGLSLDVRLLKEIGKVSTLAGIAEIILVGGAGFLIAISMGFSNLGAMYIGIALAFSSTVVVVKILLDKKEIDTLHGRITLGILIVQDILASVFLLVMPLINNFSGFGYILQQFLMIAVIIILIFFFSIFIFRRFLNYLAKSQEALFLFGIAWALIISTIFNQLGFSIEIGALIAGMSLASSKYALDLSGKMKPLRDFFVILFFVYFGSQLIGPITTNLIKNALLLSLFVILGKPLIVMVILKIFGYTKKTNFLTSINLAQISEFSLIIVFLGYMLGHLSQDIMNLSVLVALITIGLSSYAINYSTYLSNKLLKFLNLFDGKLKCDESLKNKSYDIILFGYHRMGYKLLKTLKIMGKNLLVVDYNPKVVLALNKEKVDALYGDAGNKNFLEDLPLEKAKLIVSTLPEEASNLVILEVLQENKLGATFIATAEQPRTALDLYKAGVDYVLIPHHLGGDYASHMIREFGLNHKKYLIKGNEHFKELKKAKDDSSFD